MKTPLSTEGNLGPGDVVLDGDPAPLLKKGAEPPLQFLAHFYCGQTAGWITPAFGMEVGLSPVDSVLDGDPAPSPERGRSSFPNFRPMSIVAKGLDGSRWHLARRWALVQATLC